MKRAYLPVSAHCLSSIFDLTLLERNSISRYVSASCCYGHGSIRLQPRDCQVLKLRSLPSDPVFQSSPFSFKTIAVASGYTRSIVSLRILMGHSYHSCFPYVFFLLLSSASVPHSSFLLFLPFIMFSTLFTSSTTTSGDGSYSEGRWDCLGQGPPLTPL